MKSRGIRDDLLGIKALDLLISGQTLLDLFFCFGTIEALNSLAANQRIAAQISLDALDQRNSTRLHDIVAMGNFTALRSKADCARSTAKIFISR